MTNHVNASDFSTRSIEEMVAVGATDTRSVRLWIRTLQPGPHAIEISSTTEQHRGFVALTPPLGADGTTSVCYPDDLSEATPLTPGTAYQVRVVRGEHVLGTGRFETAPETLPDSFAIGVLSCHQPFADDGKLDLPSLRTLDILDDAFRARDVKRVVMMGDQMYADYPQCLSLFDDDYFATIAPPGRKTIFDCTADEIRAIYQRRYRAFWSVDGFRRILTSYSCQTIPDDHEIVDNYGSAPEHATAKWDAIRTAALDAFDDYQGQLTAARTSPRRASFDHSQRYADVGVYALDVRAARRATEDTLTVCTDEQFEAFERYLHNDTANLKALMVVISIPLEIYPSWVASIGTRLLGRDSDAADRWSHPAATESRRRLTKLLYDHQVRNPQQKVILVSGDIHIGCAVRIVWRDKSVRPVYQLISSSVSNLTDALRRKLGRLAPHLDKHLSGGADDLWETVELLPARDDMDATNPFDGLNAGVVSFRRQRDGNLAVTLELVSHDDDMPGSARTVYATDV